MPHARAMAIDNDVGELREAMIGQPIFAPLRSISDEIRPVARSASPSVSMPCSKHEPRS